VKEDAREEHGKKHTFAVSWFMSLNPTVKIHKTSPWEDGRAKNITFIVTEDCQLQCKYCYLVGKNKSGKMNFGTARKTIDYLLDNKKFLTDKSVVLDFIGGEPLIEIELIDKICDYFKLKSYELNHPWFNSYRFSFSTNGLLYSDIKKNRTHLSIQITIDGTEIKHNLQRVYPDGKGSYDNVVKNIPLWKSQFPDASTKVTISGEDIPYIKDSVIHIWNLGIKEININVVFENAWKEGDDETFEEQLILLADEIIEKKLYENHSCTFFSKTIGFPYNQNSNWCGAGKMIAVDYSGNYYPCIRFVNFSLQNREGLLIGNVNEGLDENKLRPFLALDMVSQSTEECIDCDVATGCAWCQGANYDFAVTDTIFQRATYICKMHKARVRANNYFWNKLGRRLNKEMRIENN
jgi:uncharacterized protein